MLNPTTRELLTSQAIFFWHPARPPATLTAMHPRLMIAAVVLLVARVAFAIDPDAVKEESPNSLPQKAFEILKENKSDALSQIVMSSEDFVGLLQQEAKIRQVQLELSEEEIKKKTQQATDHALHKAKKLLAKIRASAKKTGFDWELAKLTKVIAGEEPYDAGSKKIHIDIYLTIESGKQSIIVKLDDCFFVNGHRRMADGFWLTTPPSDISKPEHKTE